MLDEKNSEVTPPEATAQTKSNRSRTQAVNVLRLAIASVAIAIWVVLSTSYVYNARVKGNVAGSSQAVPAQSVPDANQLPQNVAQNPIPAATAAASTGNALMFRDVLQKARTFCPVNQPLLVLSDSAAYQLADYFIYPRKAIAIGPKDPFGEADLTAHAGGCIVNYGDENAARLAPFKTEVTQILCSSEGCLYSIGKQQ